MSRSIRTRRNRSVSSSAHRRWSDDPHEHYIINIFYVLAATAANCVGGLTNGLYLLTAAIVQFAWAVTKSVFTGRKPS